MPTRRTGYLFEKLPSIRLAGGGYNGTWSGLAHIHYETDTRGWRIGQIWLRDESKPEGDLIPLMPDEGPDACGPYELLHDALKAEREEHIGELVDEEIDQVPSGGDAA